MSRQGLAVLMVTLQDHKHTRESWAVATVRIVEHVSGELPAGEDLGPGVELEAVGDRLGLAAAGERLELTGTWERSRFGARALQLKVADQVSQGIQEGDDACRWLERLDAVGPKRARALYARFGDRLPAILSGDEEADLTEVHGISDETERHIRESFAELAISGDLESIQFLAAIKASRWEQGKIIAWCAKKRRRPIEVLQEDPFDLMDVKGLGFAKVDNLARAAGCAPAAPARIEAAVLTQLAAITDRGSTMAPLAGGKGGGLVGESLALLGLSDRNLPRAAIQRLAKSGRVVIATDDQGRTLVHPTELLRAERVIYRAATGKAPATPSATSGGAPGPLPYPKAPVPSRRRGDSVPANGGTRQGGTPPAEEGAALTAPSTPPPAEPSRAAALPTWGRETHPWE